MTIGVREKKTQTVRPALGRDLQSIVVGDLVGLKLVDLREVRIRPASGNVRCSRRSSVDVNQIVQVNTACSHISNLEDGREGYLLLDGCVPLLAIRGLGIQIGGIEGWEISDMLRISI